MLLRSALDHAESVNLYVTLSRVSGKRIVWKTLQRYNRNYDLGGVANLSDLTLTFPNGSVIAISGAKDESEIEKWRGVALQLVVIDEAQAFRAHIEQLVDDVLQAATIETKGTICLIGTPGQIRAGYFHDALLAGADPAMRAALNLAVNDNGQPQEGDEDDDNSADQHGWSVHHWTINENPHIRDVPDELSRIRRKKRWSADHPTYLREYVGRWVPANDVLVYKYDSQHNGYDPPEAPDFTTAGWCHVVAVDQGYHDADVVSSLSFRRDDWRIWYREHHVKRKQGAQSLCMATAAVYEELRATGEVLAIVWDEGGGGKKVAEDARNIYLLPVTAAEKAHKIAGVDLTNDALRSKALRIPRGSQAAVDAGKTSWDPKARGVKFSARYHTDAWDTIVYGMRAIPPRYVAEPPDPNAPVKTADELRAEELRKERDDRIAARVMAAEESQKKTIRNLIRNAPG